MSKSVSFWQPCMFSTSALVTRQDEFSNFTRFSQYLQFKIIVIILFFHFVVIFSTLASFFLSPLFRGHPEIGRLQRVDPNYIGVDRRRVERRGPVLLQSVRPEVNARRWHRGCRHGSSGRGGCHSRCHNPAAISTAKTSAFISG